MIHQRLAQDANSSRRKSASRPAWALRSNSPSAIFKSSAIMIPPLRVISLVNPMRTIRWPASSMARHFTHPLENYPF